MIFLLDLFFMESARGVGPQGPQVRVPDMRGPEPLWGPWGPFVGRALKAQGPSGAPIARALLPSEAPEPS